MPEVTAAITTYNRADLVSAAVRSALAQTFEDCEVLVVDNGSTDDTVHALEPFRDRIRYHRQENRGRAGGRNTAIQLARGTFVAFLDSDDEWLPDKIERQIGILRAHRGVALVHGQVELVDEQGATLAAATAKHRALFARAHARGASYAGYALECRCLTSTIMARRDVLAALGGYDTGLVLEDLDLYLRLLREHEILFLDGPPLARYRVHAAQTDADDLTNGRIEVIRKHLALVGAGDDQEARLARRNLLLGLADAHYVLQEGGATRRSIAAAVRLDPAALARPRVLRQLAFSVLPSRTRSRLRALLRATPRPLA